MKMVKIKDNVDLKELEKLGFEYDDIYGYVLWGNTNGNWKIQKSSVNPQTRRVFIFKDYIDEVSNLLYSYNLVEIIEKENGE